MSPARIEEDPVVASYDIFLTRSNPTPSVYLLQYPNRSRDQPYNARAGVRPRAMRMKPSTGYLEMETEMSTDTNFNRWAALKWGGGEAAQQQVGDGTTPTYGIAAGFAGQARGREPPIPRIYKDEVDRELEMRDDMASFTEAKADGKVMNKQLLGGQIQRHKVVVNPVKEGDKEGVKEADRQAKKQAERLAETPVFFVGAFRGTELHLSAVDGTVQMRPVFHHLDAEDARSRGAASGYGLGEAGAADGRPAPAAKVLHQSYKSTPIANPRGELEEQTAALREALGKASVEHWTQLEYVDEDDDVAFLTWEERMFVKNSEGSKKLKSTVGDDEYWNVVNGKTQIPVRAKKRRRESESEGNAG